MVKIHKNYEGMVVKTKPFGIVGREGSWVAYNLGEQGKRMLRSSVTNDSPKYIELQKFCKFLKFIFRSNIIEFFQNYVIELLLEKKYHLWDLLENLKPDGDCFFEKREAVNQLLESNIIGKTRNGWYFVKEKEEP